MKDKWSTADASPLQGVDATIFAWKADQRNQYLGQELSLSSLRGSSLRGGGPRVKCAGQV